MSVSNPQLCLRSSGCVLCQIHGCVLCPGCTPCQFQAVSDPRLCPVSNPGLCIGSSGCVLWQIYGCNGVQFYSVSFKVVSDPYLGPRCAFDRSMAMSCISSRLFQTHASCKLFQTHICVLCQIHGQFRFCPVSIPWLCPVHKLYPMSVPSCIRSMSVSRMCP
ncbi:hypothetical protein CDAR_176341 [Caerostris darwini]|uniref:Uncharacterized protein n=1 Tax=Caerostris darwini TaxID=1538125 RepID=A0AAV4WP77_9ARAC|nr:hypothetical protein CDAR_176341 [Caerostris darwini]